jgi:hypothetical protein
MKPKSLFIFLLFATLFTGNRTIAQEQSTFKLSGSYRFDYEVVQVIDGKKNPSDSCVLHFFYTKSGDYAAARLNGKNSNKEGWFIVLTRDGNGIVFDDQKKNITVINLHKLMSDFSSITKWIKMDSLMAHMRQKTDGKHFESVKTGNTKQIGNYAADEYSVSDSKGNKSSIWCAKVDFSTPADYILGGGGGKMLKMMSQQMSSHPLFLALTQPKTMIAEIDGGNMQNGSGMNMHTESISQISTEISTNGYKLNDYSNMSIPEILQAELNKKGH